MMLEWMADPAAWAGLATLVALEIVLGIDNLIFIAILADKLPENQRNKARVIGLSLALFMRLGLLASISWIISLTEPVFTVFGNGVSWRDLILIMGGGFLIFKGTMELHERLEGNIGVKEKSRTTAVFGQIILQIVLLDAVFSLDSVITAVGMVDTLSIMVIAVILAMIVMLVASGPLMRFVSKHPTVVVLCLGFLLMIGFSLIVEGLGYHIPKGYLYAAICFSILIEAANQLGRRNVKKRVTSVSVRDRTSEAILRILKGGQANQQSAEEVAAVVASSEDQPAFSSEETYMIEQVLTLAQRPIHTIMIPRSETVWLDVNEDPKNMLVKMDESDRSRFPVCENNGDKVLGVIHVRDLIGQDFDDDPNFNVRKFVREPLYIVEDVKILKLIEQFKTSPVHMAIVVDQAGKFKGIVTANDVLEAIAGEMVE